MVRSQLLRALRRQANGNILLLTLTLGVIGLMLLSISFLLVSQWDRENVQILKGQQNDLDLRRGFSRAFEALSALGALPNAAVVPSSLSDLLLWSHAETWGDTVLNAHIYRTHYLPPNLPAAALAQFPPVTSGDPRAFIRITLSPKGLPQRVIEAMAEITPPRLVWWSEHWLY